ncbi:MAG: carbohydrate porin [Planctomycetota bacterium]
MNVLFFIGFICTESASGQNSISTAYEENLLGDTWGYRSWLEERGITAEFIYTADVFSNVRGGLDTSNATRFRGNADLIITLDTEKSGLWRGGKFFIYGQSGHGEGISKQHTGDLQTLSNIEAQRFNQISEYWLKQSFSDGRLRFKLGKQDANADFAACDFGADFLNSSFGIPPNVLIPIFPDPALGVASFVEPVAWLQIGAGIYDGGAKGRTSGFDTAFDGRDGHSAVAQVDYRLFLDDAELPFSTFRFGAWRHSANVEEFSESPQPRKYSANHGVYFTADQILYRLEGGTADSRIVSAFFQYSWAPYEVNEITQYIGAGLCCKGWIPGREKDHSGIGVGRALLSSRIRSLEHRNHETVFELYHRLQILPAITLQPDVQFIVNPGGDGRNAVAVGARLMIVL